MIFFYPNKILSEIWIVQDSLVEAAKEEASSISNIIAQATKWSSSCLPPFPLSCYCCTSNCNALDCESICSAHVYGFQDSRLFRMSVMCNYIACVPVASKIMTSLIVCCVLQSLKIAASCQCCDALLQSYLFANLGLNHSVLFLPLSFLLLSSLAMKNIVDSCHVQLTTGLILSIVVCSISLVYIQDPILSCSLPSAWINITLCSLAQ